jgi:hypothetical protein
MNNKVIDLESKRHAHLHKRKEAKVDALRRAFRLARGEPDPDALRRGRQNRRKSKKK